MVHCILPGRNWQPIWNGQRTEPHRNSWCNKISHHFSFFEIHLDLWLSHRYTQIHSVCVFVCVFKQTTDCCWPAFFTPLPSSATNPPFFLLYFPYFPLPRCSTILFQYCHFSAFLFFFFCRFLLLLFLWYRRHHQQIFDFSSGKLKTEQKKKIK